MGLVALSLFVAICLIGATHGTDCSYGTAKNLFVKIIRTCPLPIAHASDEYYCCEAGCCTVWGYLFSGYRLILIIVFGVIAGVILGVTRCCTSFRKPEIFSPSYKQATTPHPGGAGYPGMYK